MNSSIIRYILGSVLKIEAVLLLLPCIVSVCYRETAGLSYLLVSAACLVLGLAMTFKKPKDTVYYLKEGCVTTALSWIFLSFFGALPFWISGEIPSLTDALFETVSGFTTTGASILEDVEGLSHTALFWRSFTHWIGGMGVLVFLLAIISLNGGSQVNLLRAESPGPSVGKLVPKMKHTARILYLIYLGLTAIEVILLLAGRMPLFDALTTSFGTAGTGGFGIKEDSIGGYSPYLQWIVTIFMIAFGVNFNAYYFILFHNVKKALHMEEVRCYLGIIAAAIAVLMADTIKIYGSFFTALRHSAFQVGSIITTTGFSTADFDLWSQTSKTVLVLLMFIGACAGSTGGGIKVSRFVILIKTIGKELNSYIHPRSIKKITFDDRPLEHEVMRSTNVYFVTFVILFSFSVLLVSIEGWDMTTSFTAVAATINNIGPGLELVGPSRNFAFFSPVSKYVLIFDMLAGRLELFPLLILFHPAIWKDMYAHKSAMRRLKARRQKKNGETENKTLRRK